MVDERINIETVSVSFRRACPYIIIFAVVMFGSFIGLGVLRLYSFRLECKLNGINVQIESFQAEQVSLKQKLSSLLSPGRVFGFSKNELGMIYASNVKTLKVDGPLLADRPDSESKEGNPSPAEKEGWFYFFLEKALAGE